MDVICGKCIQRYYSTPADASASNSKMDQSTMGFHARGRSGGSECNPPIERLREFLKELDIEDREHPDVSLTHETEWCLSAFPSGLLVWENLENEDDNSRHMNGVSRENVLALWLKLAQGDLVAIEAEPWLPGSHSPPLSAEVRAQLVREAEQRSLASNRAFYEALGPERADVPCRHGVCRRGAISYSVLCRVHHFESVCRQPCPFSD